MSESETEDAVRCLVCRKSRPVPGYTICEDCADDISRAYHGGSH